MYNTTGVGQTRTLAAGRGVSRTFVIKIWNDSSSTDSYQVKGAGSQTGFTVKYLKGASGTTNITAAVLAGTYRTANISSAGGVVIRMVVTVAANAATGVTRNFLVTGTSSRDGTARDAVIGQLKT